MIRTNKNKRILGERNSRAVVPGELVIHVGKVFVVWVDEVQPFHVGHLDNFPIHLVFKGHHVGTARHRTLCEARQAVYSAAAAVVTRSIFFFPWRPVHTMMRSVTPRDSTPAALGLLRAANAVAELPSFDNFHL